MTTTIRVIDNAQLRLISAMAGEEFRNLFAVADDDQIIYQWNGASFRNIESYLSMFSAELIQLPTNYRCPPAIVEAANKLVVYNVQRARAKQPLIAGKTKLKLAGEEHIQLREFASDEDEADGMPARSRRRVRRNGDKQLSWQGTVRYWNECSPHFKNIKLSQ
jgi:DNA helicase-2/ATP-dependent DNA helicase PcrA